MREQQQQGLATTGMVRNATGFRRMSWGIPGMEGERNHLVFSQERPAVLGSRAGPHTLYPSSTDPEPTSSPTLMNKSLTKLGDRDLDPRA